MNAPDIHIGEKNTVQKLIEPTDTAANFGTGDLDTLFATPILVAMMLDASVHLVDKKLPEGYISVGIMSTVNHEKATVLGETVTVEVKISQFDGNKITFEMIAFDEIGTIGSGKHERIIVNKKKLIERAKKRASNLENHDF